MDKYGQWISVNDRLPREYDDVLVICSGKYRNITLLNAYEFAGLCDGEWVLCGCPEVENLTVTHWMPLPEQPKGNDI